LHFALGKKQRSERKAKAACGGRGLRH
jgi:hypothetical protein